MAKRGSSLCTCGCSNGNRALYCRGCQCPLPKRSLKEDVTRPPVPLLAPSVAVVTHLVPSFSTLLESNKSDIFSVRIRSQGPEYRCFVSKAVDHDKWTCYYEECRVALQARERSVCDAEVDCVHVHAAKSHLSEVAKSYTSLSYEVLKTAPFPSDVLDNFERQAKDNKLNKIVHRISTQCFVVQDEPSASNPLGILHVRIDKQKQFNCTCSKFKRVTSLCGATTAPKISRRCSHIYLCFWAVLSNLSWKEEFGLFHLEDKPVPDDISSQLNDIGHKNNLSILARKSSLEALQKSFELIPEDPQSSLIQTIMSDIQAKNANYVMLQQNSVYPFQQAKTWDSYFSPDDTHCRCCNHLLGDETKLSGTRGNAWLLNKCGLLQVEVRVKVCQNCQARHGFIDWKKGIFNVSNKLLVSLDLLFEIREHVRTGEPPGNATSSMLNAILLQPHRPVLSDNEFRYLNEKLYDGYFAFETLTKRDWDSAICGVCGICPLFESGDGNVKNCTPISNSKIKWHSNSQTGVRSEQVDVDEWWKSMEMKLLEGIVFKSCSVDPIYAEDIAPWIPPSCRGRVINTEYQKKSPMDASSTATPMGCPKALAELIRKGTYNPLNISSLSASELQEICSVVGIKVHGNISKPQMIRSLESLHSYIIQGKSECHVFEAVPSCSGGKVFKNCHHQVISASKFIMRKESTRDHADLLLSSKHWPLVYAVDMACDVVAHIETRKPRLARELWGERRGCFERPDPTVLPTVRHVKELSPQMMSKPFFYNASVSHDHLYCQMDLTHPLSRTTDRYIVGDRFHDGKKSGHKKDTCKFHHIDNCFELKNYKSVLSEVINSKIKATRLQSSSQQNLCHYFIYNRLMDYWHNRNIVSRQYQAMLLKKKSNETIVRDHLHRFVYQAK